MKVNDNITQENTNNGSDSDATVEYMPPPDPPNHNILDGTTPKGHFHNKLCGIKKGKKKRLYYCQLCTIRTYSVRELNNHYKDQHDSFHCLVCTKIFDNPHSRDEHVYMHQQNQHHCLDCDKTFPFASQLQSHHGQHMKYKRYPCWWPKCTKGFSYKCDLCKHIEVHKNKAKPKKCPYCTYMNADQRNLDRHLRTHMDYRPHKCDKCNKTFRFWTQKKRHH